MWKRVISRVCTLTMLSVALLSVSLPQVHTVDDTLATEVGKDALENPGMARQAASKPLTQEHLSDGQHNQEYDHEAILGSHDLNEEYGQMSPEMAKYELGLLFEQHDQDEDGFISREELVEWIRHSFMTLDREEARQKMEQQDTDEDGLVTWDEMLRNSYSYTQEEIEELTEDTNPDVQAFVDLVKVDALRFEAADLDQDKVLDVNEYAAYLNPYNFEYTQDFEVNLTMALYDRNGDHKVDLAEYMGDKDKNRETQLVDSENFNEYDANSDGVLDMFELRGWVLPDLTSMAEEETQHLMYETDRDGDDRLSKKEVLRKHELWVGSHAADEIHMRSEAVLHDPGEL